MKMKKIQANEEKIKDNSDLEKEFNKIYNNTSTLLDEDFEIPLSISKAKVNSKNFIFTENAIKKLKEIKYYFQRM